MKNKKLHNIDKTGFKVPKGYFDTLEDRLFSEVKLKAQYKSAGFSIPENYLDHLENTILNEVTKEAPKVIPLFNKRNLIYISSVAAAIALLFNLTVFKTKSYTFDSLDTETVESYIIEEDLINSYELATLMTEEDLSELDFIDMDLDEENVETFLLNHLDVEDLLVD